jgi:hypothetical protein
MKNQKFEVNDFEKMTPYQAFVSALFAMGRDTKALRRKGLKATETPRLRLVNLSGQVAEIEYLVDSAIWGLTLNGDGPKHFNPTTYTGILEFMTDFDAAQLKEACLAMHRDFEKILNKDAVKRLSGRQNRQAMAS